MNFQVSGQKQFQALVESYRLENAVSWWVAPSSENYVVGKSARKFNRKKLKYMVGPMSMTSNLNLIDFL